MKASFLLLLFSISCITIDAQVSLAWVKTVGTPLDTKPIDHQTSVGGDLFVFGETEDTICGYGAFFISKLDLGGNELYQTIMKTDSSCNRETPAAFSLGSGSNVFACGQQPNNQVGGLLFGLDTNGLSVSWGLNTGYYYVDCIHGFSNENYVVGNYPPELQRWSESGSFSWSYLWNEPVTANAFQVLTDNTNGIYMLVNTFETVPSTFSSGFGLVKRDSLNSSGWSMFYNPLPTQTNMPIDAVQDNSANTYILTKEIAGLDSIFVTKVSPTGQVLWNSSYGPCHFPYDLEYDQANDNIIALVKASGVIKMIRFDSNGALIDTTIGVTAQVAGEPVFDMDTLGNIYMAYEYMISSTNYITSINKFNYSGGLLWNYSYSSPTMLLPSHLSVELGGSVFTSLKIDYPSMMADSIFIIKLDQPLSITNPHEFQLNFSVFPNPTSGNCYYQLSTTSINYARYEIYDLAGKVLLKGNISSIGNGEIDLSSLSPSFYFISIFNENDETIGAPQKIIKL